MDAAPVDLVQSALLTALVVATPILVVALVVGLVTALVQAATQVIATDPEKPEFGSIALLFTPAPVTLRQWVVTDDLGKNTTVILGDLTIGAEYPASQFAIESELRKREQAQ